MVCKNHDHVGRLHSKLKPKASTADFDKQGCSPTPIGVSLGHQALAVSAAKSKGALDYVRNNGDSVCFLQQRVRYTLIRSVHDFAQNDSSVLCTHAFVG